MQFEEEINYQVKKFLKDPMLVGWILTLGNQQCLWQKVIPNIVNVNLRTVILLFKLDIDPVLF